MVVMTFTQVISVSTIEEYDMLLILHGAEVEPQARCGRCLTLCTWVVLRSGRRMQQHVANYQSL